MSELGSTIRSESETIHHEHEVLLQRLGALDAALEALVCHAEVYADVSSSIEVLRTGRWLNAWLPEHFQHEEQTLAEAAKLSPAWATFSREMVRQHREISERLRRFCKVAVELEQTSDLEGSICDLKQSGKQLTSMMAAHMGAEERKLRSLSA